MIKKQTYFHSQSFLMMNLETEIKDLLQKFGIHVHTESGNEITFYCPFHKNRNTPSFYLNKKTGLWQCFNPSCGEKGNFKKLYRQITGKSYGREVKLDPSALRNELDRAFRPIVPEKEITLDYDLDSEEMISSLDISINTLTVDDIETIVNIEDVSEDPD